MRNYMRASFQRGCCLPIPLFFGIDGCSKGSFPVPTNAGLPAGLPLLPLGFSYPQTSTDRTWGRAGAGVWSQERGQIWIAPWINSTETVIVTWDGIKRIWTDQDPIDSDPLFSKAVRLYVQAQHAGEWDHENEDANSFEQKYQRALADLIHQCREETRTRGCNDGSADGGGGSNARAANGITDLFYNDDQSVSLSCPSGQTGNPVSVTIPAGTVGSAISKGDANQKSQAQAQAQAQQQLVCAEAQVIYYNTAQTAIASCGQASGAPPPEGDPVTVTVPAGEVSSTVSQAAADASALELAQARAGAQLSCTFWNKSVTVDAVCPSNSGITASETVNAHVFSSTISQADADAQATAAATNAANQALDDGGCGDTIYWNTPQQSSYLAHCSVYVSGGHTGGTVIGGSGGGIVLVGGETTNCDIAVKVNVPEHTFNSHVSQADANQTAKDAAALYAEILAIQKCQQGLCGTFEVTYPLIVND